MKITRLFAGASLAAVMLVVASCADSSPTEPATLRATAGMDSSAKLLGLLGSTVEHVGLLTCSPMPTATASAVIGPNGGVLRVGPHALVVPSGALSGPVRITATAPSGKVNRVEFQPHGLRFERPAALSMSYANCDLLGSLLPKRIAYVDGSLTILEYLLSIDNLWNKRVTGRLDHFSEYAIAW